MTEISLQVPEMTRELALQKIRDGLRLGQQEMADWRGGPLAVSAVPGAGKSTGMAAAAALAIARHQLNARRQLVVVTFTRAAAANIKEKIGNYLKELSLPKAGFTVNTLHGLALNIASRHPELSGLNLEQVTLVTPNQSNRLIRMAVEQWISTDPSIYYKLLDGQQFDGEETEKLRRQSVLRTEILPELATTVIHEAKSSGLLPQDLQKWSQEQTQDYQLLKIAAELFQNYQNLLSQREFIDYDDMILGALRVLEDEATRRFWQDQVFAVFEDEAQDSSPLQTQLLKILASEETHYNFVRVGDPNQAINSTFTPADPIYFREFCELHPLVTMDQAGRSTAKIIEAANFTLEWVNEHYQIQSKVSQKSADLEIKNHENFGKKTPFRFQKIRAVDSNDPQDDANPEPAGMGLEIYQPEDIFQTVELIGKRVIELFTENKDKKAAVLVRENRQGQFVVDLLRNPQKHGLKVDLEKHNIEVFDVNEKERRSHVPAEILALLQFLDRPHSPDYLKAALMVLVERQLIPSQDLNKLASLPEQFLYPGPLDPHPQQMPVEQARQFCCSLLRARMELPIYHLILFIALALKYDQTELATADKLAEKVTLQSAGDSTMSTLLNILTEIVSSERFEAVQTEDLELYTQAGKLTIITMHKAKGLDWDYVFLPFLHDTLIPGSLRVPLPMKFLGDFTLSEVTRAQIRAGLHGIFPLPTIQNAWQQAEQLKIAEEFRLLYVAMTRGKRLLWMSAAKKGPFSWNKLTNLQDKKPCPILPALMKNFPDSVME